MYSCSYTAVIMTNLFSLVVIIMTLGMMALRILASKDKLKTIFINSFCLFYVNIFD